MERKFLAFSCLVLLSSMVYFIYTSYQLHIENKNQQEVTAELEAPFVGGLYISRSSPSKTENSNLEPTEGGWAAFEDSVKDFDERDETAETTQPEEVTEAEISETEGNDTGISPELEKMFIYYKGYLDRHREVSQKQAPFMKKIVEMDKEWEKLDNLITEKTNRGEEHQELVEARRQLSEEREEIFVALEPLDERMTQLEQEWEEYLRAHHGIDSTLFRETHTKALRSWLANQ